MGGRGSSSGSGGGGGASKAAVSSVEVKTHQYEASVGKLPSGSGNWWFKIGNKEVSFSGKYSEAKKKAIKLAKASGNTSITVLS